MPKYLVQANFVGEGLKGLLREGGSSRRAALEKLHTSVGGKVEALYYAFGGTGLFVIAQPVWVAQPVRLGSTNSTPPVESI